MHKARYALFLLVGRILATVLPSGAFAGNPAPHISGEWWQVAGNPDLGKYTSDGQEPVDFGIWQATDGTWQLWSCIRNTGCGGHSRLFYRWEGRQLTDTNWTPKGIAMMADPALGESKGGLQAPFVLQETNRFYMFYGDWERICLATSDDGKVFTRKLNEHGQPGIFSGPYENTRDAMVMKWGGLYYCYYTGHKKGAEYQSAIFCRTSHDLEHWSEPMMVSAGGAPAKLGAWLGADAECPFVVQRDGVFYLFRNQFYGHGNLNTQYASCNPLDFGVGDDRCRIGTMAVAAPEILFSGGQWYIVALNPGLDGIRIAQFDWR